ncbi:hypothetical protein [Paenibacillus caui]|uniref:hypothetical protein n=1 Tax=Paenibacillus caui TaxID=2873927 RepID=UPI001CA8D065|nr:hypothetical protein [Paenibacillus caui]
MKMIIKEAEMRKDQEGALLGKTVFELEGHKKGYEITFFSKKGKEWDYSLHFHAESGDEEEFLLADAYLEQNDDAFDMLLDAALDTLSE